MMGCETYGVNWPTERGIKFSEVDDTVGCLCTFPHNDVDDHIDTDRVRSLALLGAAVVLHRRGLTDGPVIYLPDMIPQWIRDGIDACLDGTKEAK